jgi:hypothetical protein
MVAALWLSWPEVAYNCPGGSTLLPLTYLPVFDGSADGNCSPAVIGMLAGGNPEAFATDAKALGLDAKYLERIGASP